MFSTQWTSHNCSMRVPRASVSVRCIDRALRRIAGRCRKYSGLAAALVAWAGTAAIVGMAGTTASIGMAGTAAPAGAAEVLRAAAAGATATTAATVTGADGVPFYNNTFAKTPSPAAMTELGRALFFDASLSASGKVACAICHVPSRAFGPPNDAPVQRGGSDGRRFGLRAVPSLMYSQNVPPFTEHYFEDEGDDGIDQGPAGGRTWDGRAQSARKCGARTMP
jgi:cytochrome c peroxidase